MHFSDIGQFIRSGSYEVDVSLDHLERTLKHWDDDYGLELNPDFQRGHVWTEEQQVSYVEFLLRGGVTAKVIYFNSPAFGRINNTSELPDTILCVDGLQRVTACLRFLRNEIKVFGHYYKEFDGSLRIMQGLKFNVNSLDKKSDILKWYIEFNSGGTIHTKEEIDRVKLMLMEEVNNGK